jgi:NagD protein
MSAWLLDLDGVVYRGGQAIPGAEEFIAWLQQTAQPFLFLTNHSARTPESFAHKVQAMGIAVEPKDFLSSATVTAEFLRRERGGKRVFAIGEEGLDRALAGAGIETVEQLPDIVVVGFDRGIHYDLLARASRFILAGAEFIGTNADGSYPLEDGPAPECGALLAAIEAATGRKPLVMGKPEPHMFEEALRRLGVGKNEAIMVGDRLDTDIAGAKRFGIPAVLVLSGATNREEAARGRPQPDRVLPNLRACMEMGGM